MSSFPPSVGAAGSENLPGFLDGNVASPFWAGGCGKERSPTTLLVGFKNRIYHEGPEG